MSTDSSTSSSSSSSSGGGPKHRSPSEHAKHTDAQQGCSHNHGHQGAHFEAAETKPHQTEPSPASGQPNQKFSRLERTVFRALMNVKHPTRSTGDEDIVYLNMVKGVDITPAVHHDNEGGEEEGEGGDSGVQKMIVSVQLEPDREYRNIKKAIQTAVGALPWVHQVRVRMPPAPKKAPNTAGDGTENARRGNGLKNVRHIVAVSSCKGGVGKSTVAVNLAYALSQEGHKVGIFDADIYGPSLPTMVSPRDVTLRETKTDKLIVPPEYEGVKTMSYGYVKTGAGGGDPRSGAAVIRGPMVSNIVTQLCSFTLWGDLDYLIMDLPPGTGDIQISLSQNFQIDAAVIVSTPQKLSFIDVVKGVEMFDKVKVPVVAVVENMCEFVCIQCRHHNFPFGRGYKQQIKQQFGIQHSFSLPILELISRHSDSGDPFVLDHRPAVAEVRATMLEVAERVVNEVKQLKTGGAKPPKVEFVEGKGIVVTPTPMPEEAFHNGTETFEVDPVTIDGKTLRINCQCALCVDEYSGQLKVDPDQVPHDVIPKQIIPKGNYAVAIVWSDGHNSSIYSYKRLYEVAKGGKKKSGSRALS